MIACCLIVVSGCILWIIYLFSIAFKGGWPGSSPSSPMHNSVGSLLIVNEDEEEGEKEKADSILVRLDQLASSLQISSSGNESKFIDRCRRECIPGRDDKSGEINPTTHTARECLRHVSEKMRQRPRIGIVIPPGRIGRAFADWITGALTGSGSGGGGDYTTSVDIDIVVTSHVPVYGYGKSHGYTKLIRFVILPLSLAAYDAYTCMSLLSTMTGGDGISIADSSLRGSQSIIMKPASAMTPPTPASIGMVLRLMMRWHCRLSHVAAHTATVTIFLEDILRDPSVALGRILSFVWRDDWEWEGGGKKIQSPENGNKENKASGVVDDEHLVVDHDGSLQRLLDLTLLVLSTYDDAGYVDEFKKSLLDAFAAEMGLSKDMTVWPCPSFWNGVNSNGGVEDDQMRIIHQISTEIVPDCSHGNPFVRCTVNRDRCEVRGDLQCAS